MVEWKLDDVFKNENDCEKELDLIKSKMVNISNFDGKLNNLKCIEEYFIFNEELLKRAYKVASYASMNYDQNQKDLKFQALKSKVSMLWQQYSVLASFVDNELLANPYEDYVDYAKESKIINEYLFEIKKLFDSKEHVLSTKEEKIISNYSLVTGGYASLYAMLQNSDFKPIKVVLSDNKEVMVSPNTYTSILSGLENQDDRRKVFEAQFGYYDQHKNTLATIYKGVVDSNLAKMRNRGYDSFLDVFLDNNKIPKDVYLSLINTVRENTAPLKRYINLRKKYFNLKEYHTYDRFLQIAKTESKFSYDEAKKAVLEALKPMGDDFVEHGKKALAEGHVDVYPREGKRSGAYSTNIKDFGPYILLNHADTLDSAFTLAHECGHSIHTLYSSESQPFATENYTIFVAEIPSTFNEQLFLDYLLKNSDDKELKIQALEQQIDGIISTFYRQTLFADYEYQAHKLAFEGGSINYDSLSKIMNDLYSTYYGIDLNTEELKKLVWAYIPHLFYTPFYVYQYATCFSASMKMYQNFINKEAKALENYIEMLKAGGSNYPVDIVKMGGVDLTDANTFKAVCEKLEKLLDELESMLNL